jgi:hypothetical protein
MLNVVLNHPGESSFDHKIQGVVAPQAAPTCVTVAGVQWLYAIVHRWQEKLLLRSKLFDTMINNEGSVLESLTEASS